MGRGGNSARTLLLPEGTGPPGDILRPRLGSGRRPRSVPQIEERGHEIATHGYSHTPLTRMTPATFEADLRRALGVTQPHVKRPILGFRAPSFTITEKTLWAVDILVRNG